MELNSKQILAKNLKKYMEQNHIDRYKLCEDLNFKYTTVSEWLHARKYPRIDSIEKIANYFGVSKSDIIEDKPITADEPSNINYVIPGGNIYQIPVFESVSAGFGAYASNEITDFIPVMLHSRYDAENTIAIKVSGDSMYPKIEDGDIVIVRKMSSVDSGDIAVVLLDREEGLVKKVEYGADWIKLISINPEYPVKQFNGEDVLRIMVVGKVVGSYKEF